jgi:putative colanic acid biosynthesis acetyltransferase WcaF
MDRISIGDYSVISQGAHLCAGSHDFNRANFQLTTAPILVGSRVWLCADTFVGPGVQIADGSVIGARGVVAKSIDDPWCVWAGIPVKRVGIRDRKQVMG